MENNKLTIEEAVEYTGIKRRTFESLNISYSKEYRVAKDGKDRQIRVYDKAVLDSIKESKNSQKHIPAIDKPTNANNANQTAQLATVQDLQAFAGFLIESFQKENQKLLAPMIEENKKKAIDISTFKDKQILNYSQAIAYSGLPEQEIKKALLDGIIKGKKTSEKGIWKIYKKSLDEFIEHYFN